MKKQVTFAERQTVHRLHQDEAFPRTIGINESQMALKDAAVNVNSGLKINRSPTASCEPQHQHGTTIQIPKTMTAAPFLKHAALTPAQREYLYTVAASYSGAHVRNLITQHYMNVLHRCIRAGDKPDGQEIVVSSVNLPGTHKSDKHSSEVLSPVKNKEKIQSYLPKISNRQARISNISATKQRKMKKRTTVTSPTQRGKSPRRARIRLLEEEKKTEGEEEEEEEEYDDSLSECLSSLSLGEWDDDAFSYS
ncbi:protein FAM216A [Centropristis striata]|uniref:protein FAM216A n=1 Tax=Centropristis striata TaxID=184440 RepID=UPI0027E1EAC0|nr:protein FAM216A [Centropristis striata]